MARIHCCGCGWKGSARPVGRGFICGGCGVYGVPCAACRDKVQRDAAPDVEQAPAASGPTMGEVLAAVLRTALLGRERAEVQMVQAPLEVMPEVLDDEPPPVDLAQDVELAQILAVLDRKKENVKR